MRTKITKKNVKNMKDFKECCTNGLISGKNRGNFVIYHYPYNIQIAMMINYNID